jgi:hypothetical protein
MNQRSLRDFDIQAKSEWLSGALDSLIKELAAVVPITEDHPAKMVQRSLPVDDRSEVFREVRRVESFIVGLSGDGHFIAEARIGEWFLAGATAHGVAAKVLMRWGVGRLPSVPPEQIEQLQRLSARVARERMLLQFGMPATKPLTYPVSEVRQRLDVHKDTMRKYLRWIGRTEQRKGGRTATLNQAEIVALVDAINKGRTPASVKKKARELRRIIDSSS